MPFVEISQDPKQKSACPIVSKRDLFSAHCKLLTVILSLIFTAGEDDSLHMIAKQLNKVSERLCCSELNLIIPYRMCSR